MLNGITMMSESTA